MISVSNNDQATADWTLMQMVYALGYVTDAIIDAAEKGNKDAFDQSVTGARYILNSIGYARLLFSGPHEDSPAQVKAEP